MRNFAGNAVAVRSKARHSQKPADPYDPQLQTSGGWRALFGVAAPTLMVDGIAATVSDRHITPDSGMASVRVRGGERTVRTYGAGALIVLEGGTSTVIDVGRAEGDGLYLSDFGLTDFAAFSALVAPESQGWHDIRIVPCADTVELLVNITSDAWSPRIRYSEL